MAIHFILKLITNKMIPEIGKKKICIIFKIRKLMGGGGLNFLVYLNIFKFLGDFQERTLIIIVFIKYNQGTDKGNKIYNKIVDHI